MLNAIFSVSGVVAFVVGYLLGSIPFGLLLTRAAGLGDVRKIGSGNIGATNVLRTGHKGLAAATLFLDGFKGWLAVMAAAVMAPRLLPNYFMQPMPDVAFLAMLDMAGLGAFLGHIFPVWLGFKGGKGVATYIGVLLALFLEIGLAFCVVWLIVTYTTRYSSLAALVAAAVTPVALAAVGAWDLPLLFAVMTALLFYKHRENIARLRQGTESKIGAKSTSPAEPAA